MTLANQTNLSPKAVKSASATLKKSKKPVEDHAYVALVGKYLNYEFSNNWDGDNRKDNHSTLIVGYLKPYRQRFHCIKTTSGGYWDRLWNRPHSGYWTEKDGRWRLVENKNDKYKISTSTEDHYKITITDKPLY
jgi:hypothetical protein